MHGTPEEIWRDRSPSAESVRPRIDYSFNETVFDKLQCHPQIIPRLANPVYVNKTEWENIHNFDVLSIYTVY